MTSETESAGTSGGETYKAPYQDSDPGVSPKRGPTETGPSEAVNLVPLLRKKLQKGSKGGDDILKRMADTVINDYDTDVKSRSERMKKLEKFQKLYGSIMKPKNFPFRNAANVNLPFLTYPVLMVHARLFDMVIPASGKIFETIATNGEDVHRAGLTEKFGNSYLRHDMPDFAVGMDETLLQMTINGSAFRRTYWNGYEERACSDFIPITDFVVPYWQKSQDPSMRDVPRYTLVDRLTIYDLEDYEAQGIFENVKGLKATDSDAHEGKESSFTDSVRKQDGVNPSNDGTAEDKPRMVLEQHRKWRMPNRPKVHPDFDGRAHAVIITVDERSRRVLRVVIREEDDPKDLQRFEQDNSKYAQHVEELANHDRAMGEFEDAVSVAEITGRPLPPDVQEPVAPLPPPGVEVDEEGLPEKPTPPRRRPIAFFTHYKCFPGEGFYGHGFGDFLAPIAEAASTILNQHIDGVTLKNARPGFISSQLRGPRGSISVQPGRLEEVNAPMGSLKDSIFWLDPPMSDPSTMPLIELLREMAEKFGGSDIMSGQPSGSNQTARGTIILNEQAMASISVMARRVKEAEKHELDKIWRLWGVFLPDEEIQANIVDENGVPGTIPISRSLFIPDARVMPASDPRMRSQRVEEATALYTLGSQNPIIAQSQPAMQALTEDLLRAMDGQKIIPLIQPPPPQPPPPPVPHWQEDANFLRGQFTQVHPDDDDDSHIKGHQAFMQSPTGAMLDKNGRDMIEHHVRNHAAQRLEKAGRDLQERLATVAGPGVFGGGPPPMAGAAGNPGVPGMAQ